MTIKVVRGPRPGDTLPNGATVMKARKIEKCRRCDGVNAYDGWIVLAQWLQGQRIEYVTWRYRKYADGVIDTYSGQYTRDLEQAITNFKERK